MHRIAVALTVVTLCSAVPVVRARAQVRPPQRIEVVAVVGCITQEDSNWRLTDASEPIEVADVDGRAVTVTMATEQPVGNETYRLIGQTVLEEFHISSHVGHWGLVKGLPISENGETRLNVVSIAIVADGCRQRLQTP